MDQGTSTATTGQSTDEVVLYSYWRSSCSYRVRIALAFKQIPYRYHAVNLIKDGGEQLKDEYAHLNPMKVVPSLLIDGVVLNQSVAILEYLEETRPGPVSLLPPKDKPVLRARARQIVNIIVADTQPLQNLKVLNMVGEDRKMAWAKHWIQNGLQGVEKVLQETAGKYCVGDQVTFADLALVPQIYNARRFGVDLEPFPIIRRVTEALEQLPEFQAAHPDAQPDKQ
jgi:maleylacetoacetate isomerase